MAKEAGWSWDEPKDNQVFYQPQAASGSLPFKVTGAWHNGSFKTTAGIEHVSTVQSISVQIGPSAAVRATLVGQEGGTWSADLSAFPGDNQTLTVTGTIKHETLDSNGNVTSSSSTASSMTRHISVRKLAFQFISPTAGQEVGIDEDETPWAKNASGTWAPAPFRFKLSDPQIVGKVAWLLDGATGDARRDSSDPTLWYVDKKIPANHLGSLMLTIEAGGFQESVAFAAVDFRPPKFMIKFPKDGHQQPFSQSLTVSGSASDVQSGIASLSWSLDGGTPHPPITSANWDNWSFPLPALSAGPHHVDVALTDNEGNTTDPYPKNPGARVRFELSKAYRPQVATDLVSLRAYLEDLLEFSHYHVNVGPLTEDGQLGTAEVIRTLYQPFDQLADARVSLGQEPVNQLRAAIEILRRYQDSSQVDEGLVGYWAFDDGAGTVASDSSGNGHTGTLKGSPRWDIGKLGGGLRLKGATDYVTVKDADKFTFSDTLSLCAWIYPVGTRGPVGSDRIILAKANEYALYRLADGSIQWTFANTDPGWNWHNSGAVAPLDQWTHLAVIYDRGKISTFANGRLVETYNGSGPINPTAGAELGIGGLSNSLNNFAGIVDEVRIYRRALDGYTVAVLAGVFSPAKLVAYWPFDKGSGTIADDASGHSYDATLQGSTWAPGRSGFTLQFDGTNSSVRLPGDPALDALTNDFTIAFWAMPDPGVDITLQGASTSGIAGTSGQHYVWGPKQGGTAYGSPDHAGVGISLGANGIAVYEHSDNYLPPLLVISRAFPTWAHIALVYQQGQPSLYIDGRRAGTGLKSLKGYVHALPEAIGGINYGHYAGLLDEVRLFDGALTNAEVAMLASVRVPTRTPSGPIPSETDYCQAMYEAILSRIGTSYEEIRLARGAEAGARDALAERLGITPDPSDDWLNQLYLQPGKATEASLEQRFGVPDTRRDPLTPGPDPLLSRWQREHLRQVWKVQDKETFSITDAEQPVIDPDVVGQTDLRLAQAGNPAFDAWTARKAWLDASLESLQKTFDASVAPETNLGTLLQTTVGHTLSDFDNLVQNAGSGLSIDADLRNWRLDLRAFRRLARLRTLTARGPLTDAEWQDVYAILLQAMKRAQFKQWRGAEESSGVTLSGDHFKVADDMPALPLWRATYEQRLAWQDRLQSRIDQEASLADAQAAALVAADQLALPVLRDALVGVWADRLRLHPADAAEFLTARLLVDLKASGSQQTTRLLQAIETMQNLLFTLRTEQMAPGHPAADWKLAHKDPSGAIILTEPDHFAGEWQWMGSYDAWRGVMLVFFFPENLLMPSLRPPSEQSQAFREFAAAVRAKSRLSRQEARAAVQAFQRKVCGLVVHLPMDEPEDAAPKDVAKDASENGNEAFLHGGAVRLKGELAGSIGLEGNAWLEIAHDDATLNLGANDTDFSVSFWFYLREGFTHKWRAVMQKGKDDSVTVTNSERTFGIWMMPEDNRIHYRISTENYWNEGSESKAEIALNSWTHVEYRKVGRQLQLYLNGVLDSEVTLGGKSKANSSNIRIGFNGGAAAAKFAIKNFQIYNYGAASAQVTFGDYHTDNDLDALRQQSQQMLQPYLDSGVSIPLHLRELFYFVPMEAALRLQQSRDFLAAEDWFETVYAYQLPMAHRKIYYGLAIEQNQGELPQRTTHWLLDELNPHTIAALRTESNPYTRFTLMSLARCFLEHADTEFTADTGPSLARARGLYLSARELLLLPDFDPPLGKTADTIPLPNPILEALRLRVDLQLAKLRQGRNIAGMKRQVELPASQPATSGLPQIGSGGQLVIPGAMAQLRPTPYHFRVLLERSKQLTGIAQQMEAAFLAAMEKRDAENYNLMKAGYDLQVAQAGTELQNRRKTEAEKGTALAELQRDRAKIQQGKYQEWLDAGLNEYEQGMLREYENIRTNRDWIAGLDAALTINQAGAAVGGASTPWGYGIMAGAAAIATGLAVERAVRTAEANAAEQRLQEASLRASHERRVQEWALQKSLADQDWNIGKQQRLIAQQHEQVVLQEGEIARIQANEAQAVANYLARKFTNAELYEWMSGVLGEVYSYFLQQATSTAQLAQNQLAFERQEPAPGFIQADYWQAPSDGSIAGQKAPDRQGLTGSARLLEDITRLDQFAFETDKRKLNLAQTFSLAQMAPYEFGLFRQTGVLPFATPMALFDQGFPGHYLRLIKRVRTSVVALIPPSQGIRATLITGGVSRVVTGGDLFQETVIRRDPEMVALTSPVNATGVFELDTQSEMLLPFEAMGVDTTWEFQMPKAANPFDFNTIADVLVTIEYTALSSFDYRKQVIQRLRPTVTADRAFSLRESFPDQWYQLHNPDDPSALLSVSLEITRADFPQNLDGLQTQQLLLSFLHSSDAQDGFVWDDSELRTTLSLTFGGVSTKDSSATPVDGTISTRRTNGFVWGTDLMGAGKGPAGKWTLTLPREANAYFQADKIQDILFIITFGGRTPPWPA